VEIEMKIRGLMMDPMTNMPVVILKEASGNSILPIWVGVHEANAIALEIERVVQGKEQIRCPLGCQARHRVPIWTTRSVLVASP